MNIEFTENSMQISPKGINLIKQFENCELTAYKCPAGVWTIGYGSTGNPNLRPGMAVTPSEADALLKKDLKRFEDSVNRLVKVPINQPMFDALVSLVFNIGEGALAESTLLRLLNQRKYAQAGAEFKRWVKGGNGEILAGLMRRRREEEKFWYSQPFPKGAE